MSPDATSLNDDLLRRAAAMGERVDGLRGYL